LDFDGRIDRRLVSYVLACLFPTLYTLNADGSFLLLLAGFILLLVEARLLPALY
jgi:hypothetical protein